MTPSVSVTRTEAICRAILEELRRRRAIIDENHGLLSVTLTVKLQEGSDVVRAVTYEDQTLHATQHARRRI